MTPYTSKLNLWLMIAFIVILPLGILLLATMRWSQKESDFKRLTSQFIRRQNDVMAHDAQNVAIRMADLLDRAYRDVQVLALLPRQDAVYRRFYASMTRKITIYPDKSEIAEHVSVPLYNWILVLSTNGTVLFAFRDGERYLSPAHVSECHNAQLCNRRLLRTSLAFKDEEIQIGELMHRYTPKDEKPGDSKGENIMVAYRLKDHLYVIGIDYRHIRDLLYVPTFPYTKKHDLRRAYENGNYTFLVDSNLDIIAHPLWWKVTGIDQVTGERVPPMRNDDEDPYHPSNFREYQSGKLREYFDRLLKVSFVQSGIDIFRAPNLFGTNRVVSVAPINYSRAQFASSGRFGHAVVTCNVEFFEEPVERLKPYH